MSAKCPECDTEYGLKNMVIVTGGLQCKCPNPQCGADLFLATREIERRPERHSDD